MALQDKLNRFAAEARKRGMKEDEIANFMQSKLGAEQFNTTPVEQPKKEEGFMSKVAGFFTPRIKNVVDTASGALNLKQNVQASDEEIKKKGEAMRQLALQARQEKDPVKKQALLAESRKLSAETEQLGAGATKQAEELQKTAGITEQDLAEKSNLAFAAKKGVGVAGEAASWLMPTMKVAKGAGIVKNILAGMATGAGSGAISAVTDLEDSDKWYERLQKGAGKGALAGGIMGGVFGLGGKLVDKISKRPEAIINRIFRFNPTDNAVFQRNTGMNASKEILARDGQAMSGMKYEEIVDYMGRRKDEIIGKLDDVLSKTPGGIKKETLASAIQEKIASLSPKSGNLGTGGAVSELTKMLDDVAQLPEEIPWNMVQKLKQQLQDAGSAAFSPSGSATPASKALADISNVLKEAIENNVKGEDVKKLNALTQLYSMAKDSIQKTMNSEAIKVSNDSFQKLLQSFPAIAGVGSLVATGNPAVAMGTVAAVQGMQGLRLAYLKPEFQTKMVGAIKKATEKMKDVNGDAIAQGIQDALTKLFSRQAPQPGATPEATPPAPTTAPGMEEVTAQAPGIQPPAQEEMFQVKDRVTGEVLQVPKSKLPEYGFTPEGGADEKALPSMEDVALAMMIDLETNKGKNITELTALANQIEKATKTEKKTNEQQLQDSLAKSLEVMEGLYFPGKGKSLAVGDKTTGLTGALAIGGRAVSKLGDQELVDRITAYENMRSMAAGIINQARGAGVLNAGEYEVMLANMPTEYSSEKAAKDWFKNIREMLVKNPFLAPQASTGGVQ